MSQLRVVGQTYREATIEHPRAMIRRSMHYRLLAQTGELASADLFLTQT
jgi:hypothetical protein